MSKKKTASPRIEKPAAVTRSAAPGWMTRRALRETIESVVVAFILAFLFRTFEAEAFVIPTGSMAPTLMGAHKDVACPECGYQYAAGASSEEDQMAEQLGQMRPGVPVEAASCPMCRYFAKVGPGSDHPTYGGDRIIVSKFTYDFSEPERWDVVVFKNPGEAQTNFIKRCVGLPNETIRIYHGDLFTKSEKEPEFRLTRRKPNEVRAMAQIVYDNDYVVDAMTKAGWPLRWRQLPPPSSGDAAWQSDDGGRSFTTAGGANERWLRYQHFVPSIYDWRALGHGRMPDREIRPLLITDFYAYNTSVDRGDSADNARMLGMHWVGDLMLECELESTDGKDTALLDLVKGGRHFRCAIELETGKATLSIDGLPDFHPEAQTAVRGIGSHEVIFANVDRQLRLWVDGDVISFSGSTDATDYPPLDNETPKSTAGDPLDLAPAGIGSRGAGLAVKHLRLWRDLYYVAASRGPQLVDYSGSLTPAGMSYEQLYQFWSTPTLWESAGGRGPFAQRRTEDFPLEDDQFFMLGDNSPASSDARLWDGEKYVARELLIGKALFIFWPHSFHEIPGTSIPFPFFPNFARMGLIR